MKSVEKVWLQEVPWESLVEINKALRSSHVTQRYASDNLSVSIGSPEDFGAFIRKEQARWEQVVRRSGMKIE